MDEVKLRGLLDDVFDQAIVYHGFTDYMRDYEVVFYCTADPRTGIPPAYLGYLFRYCVTAEIETAVASSVWAESLDDRLIEYDTGVDLPGYVWGVKWQVDYPGPSVVSDSERAARWAQALGIPFHEVVFETNGHNIRLVFSELVVKERGDGYVPHRLGPGGPDFKTPFSPPASP